VSGHTPLVVVDLPLVASSCWHPRIPFRGSHHMVRRQDCSAARRRRGRWWVGPRPGFRPAPGARARHSARGRRPARCPRALAVSAHGYSRPNEGTLTIKMRCASARAGGYCHGAPSGAARGDAHRAAQSGLWSTRLVRARRGVCVGANSHNERPHDKTRAQHFPCTNEGRPELPDEHPSSREQLVSRSWRRKCLRPQNGVMSSDS
jgi:hypothetical protein